MARCGCATANPAAFSIMGGEGITVTPAADVYTIEVDPALRATIDSLEPQPEKPSLSGAATITQAFAPAPAIPFQTPDLVLTLANPSDEYPMCGLVTFTAFIRETSQAGSNPQTFYVVDLGDGAGFQEVNTDARDTRGLSSSTSETTRIPVTRNVCLEPGGTRVITFRVRWAQGPFVTTGKTQLNEVQREIRFFGAPTSKGEA